jgi:hypothetical protein
VKHTLQLPQWGKITNSCEMMEAVRTSETSVDNNFTRQYIPEDNSEHYKFNFSGTERRGGVVNTSASNWKVPGSNLGPETG